MTGQAAGGSRRAARFTRIAIVTMMIAASFVVAPPAMAAPPHVGFELASDSAGEADGTVDVVIELTTDGVPLTSAIVFDVVDAGTGTAAGSGPNADYSFTSPAPPLQFDIGDDTGETRTAQITVLQDALDEGLEEIDLELQEITADGIDLTASTYTLTITDDDPEPSLSIEDAAPVSEGGTASFDVTLSTQSGRTVTVQYATANGSAVAPGDYDTTSGTLTFIPGDTTKTVTVDTNTDGVIEANESFTVELSVPVNATISDGSGSGTIQDGTALPSVSIADAGPVSEGGTASFDVELSASLGSTVTVQYATANGTAVAPGDYDATSGTVTFIPGDTLETVTVSTNTDGLDEPSESFAVNLSAPSNATLGDGTGLGTITDIDNPPTVSIADGSAVEGAGSVTFNVTLSAPSGFATSVNYATTPGSAVTPGDFTTSMGTVNFAPNDTSETITVPIVDDLLDEPDETFTVTLSSPSLLVLGVDTATGTITDDDPTPSLSVNSVQVEEGLAAGFTVSLSAASGRTVTVNRATANGTATAPADYVALPSAPLTFLPGETTKTVSVSTVEDAANEANETFTLVLSGETNATIAGGVGTGTILDDDGPPGLSALDATPAAEGSAGIDFTIALLPASGQTVRVDYATADGTAKSTSDYTAVTGFVEFAPGEKIKTVTVPITNDTTDEITETLFLNLSTPVNAAIADAQGTGSILDDDNVDPTSVSIKITDQSGTPGVEFATGETVRLEATFVDAGIADTHTVTLDWGDGSPADTFVLSPVGTRTFERMHAYASTGFQTISLTVADADGGSGGRTAFVNIVASSGGGGSHRIGLVDPATGRWRMYDAEGRLVTRLYYGNPGDYPFMGDWNCNGIETPGLYRQSDGYVYLRNLNTEGVADIKFFFGNPGDVPIAGDFNGDGCDTVSIYRPSNQTFYIINKLGSGDQGLGAAEVSYVFGNPGDKPFVGDFNGDGIETAGLHRESTGLVYFRNTHTQGIADALFIFGDPGDRLVAGDWTGDGTFTPALFRPSNTTMYFRYTNTQGIADDQWVTGQPPWLPVSGVTGF